jgi:hypothetical protein
MAEEGDKPSNREIAAAIRRVADIYRQGGVKGTIGTADVLRMLRSQGKSVEADELERLLALIKGRGSAT